MVFSTAEVENVRKELVGLVRLAQDTSDRADRVAEDALDIVNRAENMLDLFDVMTEKGA